MLKLFRELRLRFWVLMDRDINFFLSNRSTDDFYSATIKEILYKKGYFNTKAFMKEYTKCKISDYSGKHRLIRHLRELYLKC